MISEQPLPSLFFACIQMDIKLGDIKANISHAEQMISSATKKGANVILLPELFTTGYDLANSRALAEKLDGPTVQWMTKISKENNITLMGSIIEVGDDLPYNTLVVCSPEGLISSYRKIHLFAPMGEADAFIQGNSLSVLTLSGWKIGLAICYDLRFADMFVQYSNHEIDLLILCAEWPSVRIAHWDALLLARAIESQFYVVACNRVGSDLSNSFGGHSQIITPSGDLISKGSNHEEIVSGIIDLDLVPSSKKSFSIVTDRKRFAFSDF
ncbi:MAG: carbon-nitrogen family hydrolase [Candidatus Kariarchaeaceae archaeon]